MKINVHQSSSRGVANHGWLDSRHTYSFADYYHPERMGFGVLRVINDDRVAPSRGFGTHPHQNMEIISIPLSGALRHQDSMGNQQAIQSDEVQVMSAGTGITHSEYNYSDTEQVNFLQIWVLPKKMNIEPSYRQLSFNAEDRKNKFQLLVSPDGRQNTLAINQGAYFSRIDLEEACSVNYPLFCPDNGVYLFVISGSLSLGNICLNERDGAEISNVQHLNLTAQSKSQLLCIEIPMA